MDFANRTIAIIGAAATGRAAAPVLARRGARVVVFDAKAPDQLGEALAGLRAAGIELRLGGPDYRCIEEADLLIPSPGVPADARVIAEARRRGTPVVAEIEVASLIAHAPILAVT